MRELKPMLKRQCNMIMIEKKRAYDREINQVIIHFEESTIGQGKQNEKVLFFADTHFLFLILNAHLAHCLLPTNTLNKRHSKSQKAKLQTLLDNRLIRKVVLNSKKSNNLVIL
jgi:hypothetical protein